MSERLSGLSGQVIVRNGDELDYCWREAVRSLLPVCDEVWICDAESTDGTFDEMKDWVKREPKLMYARYPWPNPVANPRFVIEWINWTRQFMRYDMHIFLAADEVLGDTSYPGIRKSVEDKQPRWVRRLNFWQDAQHLAPEGTVCGSLGAQIGPTDWFMPLDELYPEGEPEMREKALRDWSLVVFHYGFIRKPGAFLKKSRVMQKAIMNMYDNRLLKAETEGTDWVKECPFPPEFPLGLYDGRHPPVAYNWLQERGHKITP